MARPILDRKRICVTAFNFFSAEFYDSLGESIEDARRAKTLHVLIYPQPISLPYRRYYSVFNMFDGTRTFDEIVERTRLAKGLTEEERLRVLSFLRIHERYTT